MTSIYDTVEYPSHAHPQSHPDRMAVVGMLLGMKPTPVERCRVLEVGCGDGGNLIPMALTLPRSEFVGVDLAASAIEKAQRLSERLNLTNTQFRAMDLMEFSTTDWGQFDYIIAHGFYSWVPDCVREKLLQICQELLTPQGIAFVSYNAYPGGHIRRMSLELMQDHLQGSLDVAEGRRALAAVAAEATDPLWKQVLEAEVVRLSERPDHVTFHDEFGPFWRPFSITEIATAAERHGLQYLAESKMKDPLESVDLPAGDLIRREQHLDYVHFREFRRTLLCRAECRWSELGRFAGCES